MDYLDIFEKHHALKARDQGGRDHKVNNEWNLFIYIYIYMNVNFKFFLF